MTTRKSPKTTSTSRGSSKITTEHSEIKRWAEARGAKPASVKGTGGKEAGVLRLMFPGYSVDRSQSLREITWEEFFTKFEENKLAFIYQNETVGGVKSNFNKFIKRK
jgi:hypothetical protein